MYKIQNVQYDYHENLLLPIGAVANTLNVHQRTLRIYDREGIIQPNRSAKNRRLYSIDDFKKLEFIIFLTRNLGLNLAGVKIIMSLMKSLNINPEKYMDYLQKTAFRAGFDENVQRENIIKAGNKGRKRKDK